MPTKQVKFNKYKHKNHPWITYGTIESIKHKDTLYKVLCALTSRSPRYEEAEAHFKMYCAKLQKSIRKAKRDHYKEDFEKSKDNTKKPGIRSIPSSINVQRNRLSQHIYLKMGK